MRIKKRISSKIQEEKKDIEDEDFDEDFDFSMYEEKEKKEVSFLSIHKSNKPPVTNLRSKWSPSLMELENLSSIRQNISQFSISVAANSQDITDLWKLYGCLNEYWAKIHDVFGSVVISEMDKKQIIVREELKICNKENLGIDYKMHLSLLNLRDCIYMLAQRINLGLEVESSSFSRFDRARKGIVE